MTDARAQPDGAASLRDRERWLRRRRGGRLLDRSTVALWTAIGAVVGWLGMIGFLGLSQ